MKIFTVILLCLMFISCERDPDENKIYHKEGYIVGFDPCTIRHHYDTGYAIITSDLADTLMTYNFPDTIYSFPSDYFKNFYATAYFPSKARYEFRVKITYSIAKENEKIFPLCLTDINMADFHRAVQVIIISASKY